MNVLDPDGRKSLTPQRDIALLSNAEKCGVGKSNQFFVPL